MFTISVFTNIDSKVTPEIAAAAKEAELAARKEKTKDVWNWSVMTNEETNEACIDFVCCSGKDGKLDIVEFDVHRQQNLHHYLLSPLFL